MFAQPCLAANHDTTTMYGQALPVSRFLHRSGPSGIPAEVRPLGAPGQQPTLRAQRVLVCAFCTQRVTSRRDRIEVGGGHEHTFLNPLGLVYRIGCFSRAPGVAGIGAHTQEHTWFPGCLWQVVVCRGCAEHLGWSFTGPEVSFFGLIVDRLREQDQA